MPDPTIHPSDVNALIRHRRSNLQINAAITVSRDVLEQLCEVVKWAPNHKRTWPARIAVMSGESRRALSAAPSISWASTTSQAATSSPNI